MLEEFKFRPLRKADCRQVAAIRLESMEWGFLPAMGEAFYTELLKATCESKYGFGIICKDQQENIAGFVCATTHLQNYHLEIILRRGIILIFRATVVLLRQPKLVSRLIPYIRYSQKALFKHIKAEWLTMVVKKEYRGKGIGKRITNSLINEYKKRNIKQFKSTVPSDNIISCSLHEQFGFRLLGAFDLGGEMINIYNYEI